MPQRIILPISDVGGRTAEGSGGSWGDEEELALPNEAMSQMQSGAYVPPEAYLPHYNQARTRAFNGAVVVNPNAYVRVPAQQVLPQITQDAQSHRYFVQYQGTTYGPLEQWLKP